MNLLSVSPIKSHRSGSTYISFLTTSINSFSGLPLFLLIGGAILGILLPAGPELSRCRKALANLENFVISKSQTLVSKESPKIDW